MPIPKPLTSPERSELLAEFQAEILTPDLVAFLDQLSARFAERRRELLAARDLRQERFDAGELPTFLEETRDLRESAWRVAPIPPDIEDRRVEITGPTDRRDLASAALAVNRYGAHTEEGVPIDNDLIRRTMHQVVENKRNALGETGSQDSKYPRAGELLLEFTQGPFRPFLTTQLYGELA